MQRERQGSQALPRRQGLLARLRKDTRGNTLMLTAASMIPLVGLIGSGVDMGRLYATKTRLQQACDAAALAGRKAMIGTTFTTDNENLARDFFRSNFPDSKYGTDSSTITFAPQANGALKATARANVPMSLMKIFGYTASDTVAECQAELNLSNTDIMFVLDTTGSMADRNPSDADSRMVVMRNAVKSFYDQVEAAKSSATQIRYGFVPYSQTVNVGHLLKPEWIADKWTYQSREFDKVQNFTGSIYNTYTTDNWSVVSGSYSDSFTYGPLEACAYPNDTVYNPSQTVLSTSSSPYAGPPAGTQTITWKQQVETGFYYWLEQSPTVCKIWKRTFDNYTQKWREITYPVQGSDYSMLYWNYKPVEYDTSALVVGGKLATMTGYNHTARDVTWNGCIEERETAVHPSYNPIPKDAYDLDIDLVPTSDKKTQWGPWLPDLVWSRYAINAWSTDVFNYPYDTNNFADYLGGLYAACPSPSRKLDEISPMDLDNYLTALVPKGNTYHDIGLVWGARLLSPTGLFASENATAVNGASIARHLIFMTDGDTDTEIGDYDAYGVNALDRRRRADKSVLPLKEDMDKEVEDRFAALCTEVKNKNITLWVIAFGTAKTKLLEDCATPGRAFEASSATVLNETFASIAATIAQLRITE